MARGYITADADNGEVFHCLFAIGRWLLAPGSFVSREVFPSVKTARGQRPEARVNYLSPIIVAINEPILFCKLIILSSVVSNNSFEMYFLLFAMMS